MAKSKDIRKDVKKKPAKTKKEKKKAKQEKKAQEGTVTVGAAGAITTGQPSCALEWSQVATPIVCVLIVCPAASAGSIGRVVIPLGMENLECRTGRFRRDASCACPQPWPRRADIGTRPGLLSRFAGQVSVIAPAAQRSVALARHTWAAPHRRTPAPCSL